MRPPEVAPRTPVDLVDPATAEQRFSPTSPSKGRGSYEMGTSEECLKASADAAVRRRLREETPVAGGSSDAVGSPGGTDAELTVYRAKVMKGGYPQIAEIFMETYGAHKYPMIVQVQAGVVAKIFTMNAG
eukprot:7611137-Heterocapsa_arctica.AAC.1